MQKLSWGAKLSITNQQVRAEARSQATAALSPTLPQSDILPLEAATQVTVNEQGTGKTHLRVR